jgi:hypothetical protein
MLDLLFTVKELPEWQNFLSYRRKLLAFHSIFGIYFRFSNF